jgi:hypothetical protein
MRILTRWAVGGLLLIALAGAVPFLGAQGVTVGGAFQPALDYVLGGQWTWKAASPFVFEGASDNDFETTFTVTDPTADRTITFPDLTGTIPTTEGNTTVTGRWFVRDDFMQGYFIYQDDLTVKSVTDAEVNVVFGSPLGIISYREELTKTASSWIVADGALDITADNTTDNEGVEIVFGGVGTNTTEGVLVAGTNGACLTMNLTIALIAGTDQVVMGWRDNQTFLDVNAYAGYTVWNVVGVNNVDGSIFSQQEVSEATDLDDSGVNWANAQTRTLKSCISAAGVPTAYYTAASGTTFTAITMTETGSTLTAGVQLWPFFSYMQAGGAVDAGVAINWVQLEAAP